MNTKSRFIKLRVSPSEYCAIVKRADATSQTQSAYVRDQLLSAHESLDIKDALDSIRGLITCNTNSPNRILELVTEAVFLLRELVAIRDPQLLIRVRAQIHQQFNEGEQ